MDTELDDEARHARPRRRADMAVRADLVEEVLRDLQRVIEYQGDPATRTRRRTLLRGIRVCLYLVGEKFEKTEVRRLLEEEVRG